MAALGRSGAPPVAELVLAAVGDPYLLGLITWLAKERFDGHGMVEERQVGLPGKSRPG